MFWLIVVNWFWKSIDWHSSNFQIFLCFTRMQSIDTGCQSIDFSQNSKNFQFSHMNFIFLTPYPSYITLTLIITFNYTITGIEQSITKSSQSNMLQFTYQVMDHKNQTHNSFITSNKFMFMFNALTFQQWKRITCS